MKNLPAKVIIIGAGPSALFAARKLREIAKSQDKNIEIIFLEKEAVVGGKCHTYADPKFPELRSEWGAGAIAVNYGVVIDALEEHGLHFEKMLPTADGTVELKQKFEKLSDLEKLSFIGDVAKELYTFNSDYEIYQRAKQKKTELPQDLLIPFYEYAQKREMENIPLFLKPLVPGFGYGALSHCPAYCILEYMGKVTIPEILLAEQIFKQPSLLAVHGGFQLLMEKIAEHWDVRLKSSVTSIKREENKVTVQYEQGGELHTETADTLVLATSPRNWPALNLDMTPTEKNCVDQLEYYRYPVAVYKIKGLPANQYFFPEALEESGFGQLALITSRDGRDEPEDGRLCTVYINLPPNTKEFAFDHVAIKNKLQSINGVTECTMIEEKIWEDYMSTLPWDLRLELDKEQRGSNTIYLGSYVLGGFEDVLCVANKAIDTMTELYTADKHYEEEFSFKQMQRAGQFFTIPIYAPLKSVSSPFELIERCTLF